MKRVTCFKLCYALGVNCRSLESDYSVEYRVAFDLRKFNPSMNLKRFRVYAAVFNECLRGYKDYVDISYFRDNVPAVECAEECSYSPVADRGFRGLREYMNSIAAKHNSMVEDVHRDLEIEIPLGIFKTLTMLPEVTGNMVAQTAFMVSKTNHIYGLQFHGHEILNVSLGSMLQDDLSLRDRLSLFTGERLSAFRDTSEFGLAIDEYIGDAFIEGDALSKYVQFYVYCEEPNKLHSIVSMLAEQNVKSMIAVCMEPPSSFSGCEGKKAVCITPNAAWVAQTAPKNLGVDFVVTLPIEQKYYKQWRNRRLPNVYMINK